MRLRISFSAWYCFIFVSRRLAGSAIAEAFFPYNSRSDLVAISYSSISDTNLLNPCCQ